MSPYKTVFAVFFCFLLNYAFGQPLNIHNTIKEINSVEDNITLKLSYEWCLESSNKDKMAFYVPGRVEINESGDIYILDRGNNQIKVFDNSRNFKYAIGKEGQGPGEFNFILDYCTDKDNNLLVLERNRVQIFDSSGIYMKGFNLKNRYLQFSSVTSNVI